MRPWLPLALAAACLAHPAAAFDLTGTWEGKQTCKGSDGAKFSFVFPTTLRITQTGTVLAMEVVSDAGSDFYNGTGIDGTAKPENGEAYFVHCGTTFVPATGKEAFDETGRGIVKTKETGSGSFKGTSNFYNGEPEVANCKWSYKRTLTADPAVLSCPAG
jgi:hypothetical protein